MRQNIFKVLFKSFKHFHFNITGVKMSIQSIVFTVLIMVLKVEHPLVDDGGFHDGNSASLSDQVMYTTQ